MSWIISVGIALLIILIINGISNLMIDESLEEVFIHLILDVVCIILSVGVVIIVHKLLF